MKQPEAFYFSESQLCCRQCCPLHPPPCVSNTSLCLSHLLELNEPGGLIMIFIDCGEQHGKEVYFLCAYREQTKNRRSYAVSSHYRECNADVYMSAILSAVITKKHSDVCTMQIDACALDVIFTTHFAALDVSLGFVLTSEVYNSDWTSRKKKKPLSTGWRISCGCQCGLKNGNVNS